MQREAVVARLLRGLVGGDDLTLAGVLHPSARMLLDTGDGVGGDIHGRADVIRGLRSLLSRHADAAPQTAHVNGSTGLVLRRHDGAVVVVVCLDLDAAGAIRTVWVTADASRLRHWNRRQDDGPDRRGSPMPSQNGPPPGRS
ncbi:hypothetical protein [Agromyces sp. Marseille-P2726]|uniref:hypothetical protein n=1 Tax=Agromyces sp. Marseille-P2726 TaxID=2709132 RepID=UPI00156E7459|nr:hypothetical protein [Agromyces sp. Marseille-P2726]